MGYSFSWPIFTEQPQGQETLLATRWGESKADKKSYSLDLCILVLLVIMTAAQGSALKEQYEWCFHMERDVGYTNFCEYIYWSWLSHLFPDLEVPACIITSKSVKRGCKPDSLCPHVSPSDQMDVTTYWRSPCSRNRFHQIIKAEILKNKA